MRKKAAIAGAALLTVLLALIFLSRTIYFYSIPTVTASSLSHGKLHKTENAKGVVDWSEINELYAPIGGKVAEVFVEEGDMVVKGQQIARLSFDEDDIRDQIAQLDTDRIRTGLSVESIHDKIARAQKSIAEWKAESYTADNVSDKEIRDLRDKTTAKKADIAEKELLYAAGTLTLKELDTARNDLTSLEADLIDAQNNFAENHSKSADDLSKKEKDRTTQIENLQYEIASYEQELKNKDLDLSENSTKKAKLEAQLTEFEASGFIYAEADAKIITLNLQKGKTINEDELVGTFGIGGQYLLECDIALENNFVAIGDECTISNTNHSYRVQVSRLEVKDGKKHITIKLEEPDIEVGETFDIAFRKDSAESHTLVPNSALNQDSNGYFVYVVKTRKGILGEEYYVQKQPIQIGDADSTNSIVTRGMGFFDPIVTLSDKPFDDNATVKLKNEGDFIVQ